jgi:histidinol-phosphate/aromatic aminotransferase/cobyric acid decarboxylase-like protein
MPTQEEIREEQIRMMKVRLLADLTAYRLPRLQNREQALALIEQVREQILALCPGKDEVFELVLRTRFLRILNECAMAEWDVMDN